MKLTARQINMLDEIERDRASIAQTLNVALVFHANQINEVNKRHEAAWQELAEIYGFDLQAGNGWTLKAVDGAMTIVPQSKD